MQVLIADDHPIFRDGLRHTVNALFDVESVHEAGEFDEVWAIIEQTPSLDLVILDIFFPGFNIQTDFRKVRQKLTSTPIIAISMTNNHDDISQVMDQGANGFISKSVKPAIIKQAIREIMDGERIIRLASGAATSNQPDPASTQLPKLSGRQLQVLRLMSRGLSNKEIANELEISPNTVRIHVSALLGILGVSTRSAAAAFAARRGLS